jgi:hypothetical protein
MKRILLLCLATILSGTALADSHAQPTVYGQYFGIVVSDPEAVVAAMTRYRKSATGQKLSSTVTLNANVANGRDQATHTVTVFYPSAAAMEADMAASMGSSDRAAFVDAMNNAATIEAENVFTQTHTRTNDESLGGAGAASMLFGLTVFDAERYSKELDKILNSDAAAAFPGNMSSGTVVAMGEVPGTHWVAFQAKDMGTLLSGVEAFMSSSDFAEYAEDASEFRRVEGRYISRNLLTLTPQ